MLEDLPLEDDELPLAVGGRGTLLALGPTEASLVTAGAPAFEMSFALGIALPLPPPAEDAEPFCAETQTAHNRKANKQAVVRFSHCIGTPPRMGPRGIGKPSNSPTSYSGSRMDGSLAPGK